MFTQDINIVDLYYNKNLITKLETIKEFNFDMTYFQPYCTYFYTRKHSKHTSSKNIFFIRLHSFWWKIHSSSLLFKFMKTNEDSSFIQKNEEWIFTPLHSFLVIFIFIPRHSSSFTLITPNHDLKFRKILKFIKKR